MVVWLRRKSLLDGTTCLRTTYLRLDDACSTAREIARRVSTGWEVLSDTESAWQEADWQEAMKVMGDER